MLPVAIAMLGTRASVPTLGFVGWFGPRGLASIVFAVIVIEQSNLPHEHLIVLAIYVTVGLSVLAHGLTAAPLAGRYARWYEQHPRGHAPPMESAHTEVTRPRGPLGQLRCWCVTEPGEARSPRDDGLRSGLESPVAQPLRTGAVQFRRALSSVAGVCGYVGGDSGSLSVGAFDGQCAAECLEAVAEAAQATVGMLGCAADAVVDDFKMQRAGRERRRVRASRWRGRAFVRWSAPRRRRSRRPLRRCRRAASRAPRR